MARQPLNRLRWIALLATVMALTMVGSSLAATPRLGFYSGTGVTAAGNKSKLKVQVGKSRRGKLNVTILNAQDGCVAASTEGSRKRLRNGHFGAAYKGGTQTAGFTYQFDGQFPTARSATVSFHTVSWYYPSSGASTCEATTTIEIHRLK
jgi:hypothetical protein